MIKPEVISYFQSNIRFKEICVGLMSSHYPWHADQIKRYKSILDFERIRFNSNNLTLSIDDLETLKDHLDWSGLHKINGIEYDLNFFEKYEDSIDFTNIHFSSNVDWSNQLLDRYREKWDWKGLSSKYITSIPRNIKRYEGLYDWNTFSGNSNLKLSEKLIDEYYEKWNWSKLSANSAFKVNQEGIEKYSEKLCWEGLSRNPSMVSFILAYPNKYEWDWYSFALNQGIVLSEKLIAFLIQKLQSELSFLRLSENQIREFAISKLIMARLNTVDFNLKLWDNENYKNHIPWSYILQRKPELLSPEQIEKYLDLEEFNKTIPYNIAKKLPLEFIEKHPELLEKFSWSIFRNSPVDKAFIEKYIKDKDWCQLAFNEQFDWTLDFLISNLDNLANPYGLGQNKTLYNLFFGEATKEEVNDLLESY